MNQPTAPCSPPSRNSSRSQGRRRRSIRPVAQNQISGPRKTTPISRPHSRWVHSSQKMWRKPSRPKPCVQQRVLRDLLIQPEQLLPVGVVQRRQDAADRRPFHDRQAGAGQPGDAAEHDHDQDHAGDDEQPGRHEPAVALAGGTVFRQGAGKIPHVEWHARHYKRRDEILRRTRGLRYGATAAGSLQRGARELPRRADRRDNRRTGIPGDSMSDTALRNADIDAALTEAKEAYVARNPKSLARYVEATAVMPGGNTRTVLHLRAVPAGDGARRGLPAVGHGRRRIRRFPRRIHRGLYGHSHPVIRAAVDRALDGGISFGASQHARGAVRPRGVRPVRRWSGCASPTPAPRPTCWRSSLARDLHPAARR